VGSYFGKALFWSSTRRLGGELLREGTFLVFDEDFRFATFAKRRALLIGKAHLNSIAYQLSCRLTAIRTIVAVGV
jgi:hypothetical protein